MMNAAEYKALQINKIIKDSNVYRNYFNLKKLVSDKYQDELALKALQQELVTLAYEDEEKYQTKKNEYLNKKDVFYNDPLMSSFIDAYAELQRMILDIKKIIELGV
ncbi:MAG: YlbF family regulator [Bacilli bacterium]|jgi:cell fate (sporulation/competence/biofilm development) regulator YlbF (YheA/YmcA/DUF963 family)|nr:YlbF family regulator [Bacilli bacterium]